MNTSNIFKIGLAVILLTLFFFKPLKKAAIQGAKNMASNNPFNIRNVRKNGKVVNNWDGLVNSFNPFCEFVSIQYGIRAGIKLYLNYLKAGHNTVEKFITRFAPPSENKTAEYINFVSKKTGFHPTNYTLTKGDAFKFLSAVAWMENNYTLDKVLFNEAEQLL